MNSIQKQLSKAIAILSLFLTGCTAVVPEQPASEKPLEEAAVLVEEEPEEKEISEAGDIEILFTSDMHCGVNEGFGVVGLQQIREVLERKGVRTLLVDDGDAIQGDIVGTLTKGSAIITLMNDLHYDAAIPGNHEFDYGMETFLELTEQAEFPYISCNFNQDGKLLLDPYIIKEVSGKKIAFIGVTTPKTLTSSSPANFMDETGEIVYSFMQDDTGDLLWQTIQKNVDEVREQGVDYVIVMSHIGNEEIVEPFNFQNLIEHTSGIDVVLDGHSHDTDQVVMKNKDGESVYRSACGTKLQAIGYVRIDGKSGAITTGLYSLNSDVTAAELFGLENELSEPVAELQNDLEKTMAREIGKTEYALVANDPEKTESNGAPLRIVRCQETNLGDFAADAIRSETGTDIAFANGGGIRDEISAGTITYADIINVFPFSNQICVSKLSGQQILDALEWGARSVPGQTGAFLHPSGLTYEIHADIPSSISITSDGLFASVDGEYRVKNVMVGDEPLDLSKTYTVAGLDFFMKYHGSGFGMMGPDEVILDEVKMDNQVFMDYITGKLNGVVGEEYANPYGQGRIKITGAE